jgi:hypothetical protein
MLEHKCSGEKRDLLKQLREVKTDMWSLKVSFVYINPNPYCYQILLFVAFHRVMGMEIVSLPSTAWINFKTACIQII